MMFIMRNYIWTILVLSVFFVGVYFWQKNPATSEPSLVKTNLYGIKTNFGEITVELFEKDAPKTVANFIKLAESGFYGGTKFHRVIPGFMIQGGDPNSKDDNWADDGFGGPDYKFEDEINGYKLIRGALAMANSGPNTNGSQFFIVTADATPWLDGKHTVFGRVTGGIEIVDTIEKLPRNASNHPTEDAVILGIEAE